MIICLYIDCFTSFEVFYFPSENPVITVFPLPHNNNVNMSYLRCQDSSIAVSEDTGGVRILIARNNSVDLRMFAMEKSL